MIMARLDQISTEKHRQIKLFSSRQMIGHHVLIRIARLAAQIVAIVFIVEIQIFEGRSSNFSRSVKSFIKSLSFAGTNVIDDELVSTNRYDMFEET